MEGTLNKISHILCPVDFSDTSAFALTYANLVAADLDARVTAFHCYQLLSHVYPDDLMVDATAMEQDLAKLSRKRLEEMVQSCGHRDVDNAMELQEGVDVRRIVEAAEHLGVDLIVMGTHGRTGISHALMGSVAERVVRHSAIPVLTVRKPAPR